MIKSLAFATILGMLITAGAGIGAADTGSARGGATELTKAQQPAPAATVAAKLPAKCERHAAACPDCRDSAITVKVNEGKRTATRTIQQHLCQDCKTSIQTTGHGKAKADSVSHVCTMPSVKGNCCAR